MIAATKAATAGGGILSSSEFMRMPRRNQLKVKGNAFFQFGSLIISFLFRDGDIMLVSSTGIEPVIDP
jgi:hypothetical protein